MTAEFCCCCSFFISQKFKTSENSIRKINPFFYEWKKKILLILTSMAISIMHILLKVVTCGFFINPLPAVLCLKIGGDSQLARVAAPLLALR